MAKRLGLPFQYRAFPACFEVLGAAKESDTRHALVAHHLQ
jgi:hypothetical protein